MVLGRQSDLTCLHLVHENVRGSKRRAGDCSSEMPSPVRLDHDEKPEERTKKGRIPMTN
jgi:hypothetical protein